MYSFECTIKLPVIFELPDTIKSLKILQLLVTLIFSVFNVFLISANVVTFKYWVFVLSLIFNN